MEFLSQFWSAFLSGDPGRVGEVTSLVESLNRAADRIEAVGNDAEQERNTELRKVQKLVDETFKTTNKKQRINYKAIPSGREVVKQLLGHTTKALTTATARYQRALEEQTRGEGG